MFSPTDYIHWFSKTGFRCRQNRFEAYSLSASYLAGSSIFLEICACLRNSNQLHLIRLLFLCLWAFRLSYFAYRRQCSQLSIRLQSVIWKTFRCFQEALFPPRWPVDDSFGVHPTRSFFTHMLWRKQYRRRWTSFTNNKTIRTNRRKLLSPLGLTVLHPDMNFIYRARRWYHK